MPDVAVEIKGLNELRTKLQSLGPELARGILTSGLEAAAAVIAESLAANTPARTGDLRAHVTTSVEVAPSGTSGIAKAGFGERDYKALWVEYGHRIVTHKPESKEIGHVPAHPFARRASEQSKAAARDAVLAAARTEIEKLS